MTTYARSGFLASLRNGLAALERAWCKLNRIQYDAPWRTDRTSRC